MSELLFEIGTEEIPSIHLYDLIAQMRTNISGTLSEQRVEFSEVKTFGTPRRLVAVVEGVADKQKDVVRKIRGPRASVAFNAQGEPTAALGFARSKGVKVEDLVIEEDEKGVKYVYAYQHSVGKPTTEVLPEILKTVITSFRLPKSMRWGSKVRFLRPIRWIVALFGGEIVPFSIDGCCSSGRTTRGHRFMGSQEVTVMDVHDYFEKMKENFVVVDPEERRKMILEGAERAAEALSFRVDWDEELLRENVSLVEYPTVIIGRFDEDFLKLPEEVLITVLKHHQRYFPVRDSSGKLLTYFVSVSNNRPKSVELIREGNEHVVKARLKDAVFFWEEDIRKPLSDRVESLKNIVFQEELGSMYDKTMRLVKLSALLVKLVGREDKADTVYRTALLSKTDLTTSMVYELPELQGIMGREYAKVSGEQPEVAEGIFEHLLPRFRGDKLPSGLEGAVVGICDRCDTIVGAVKVGMMPTGSQDPYGLRRSARGIVEIVWGREMDFSLMELIRRAAELLGTNEECVQETEDFIVQRLKAQLREEGYEHDVVDAVISGRWDRLLRMKKKLDALVKVRKEENFKDLVLAVGRIKNILKGKSIAGARVDRSLFRDEAEAELHSTYLTVRGECEPLLKQMKYGSAIRRMQVLVPVVNRFFDKVLVMDNDIDVRNNRLALLTVLRDFFMVIGDLSLLTV